MIDGSELTEHAPRYQVGTADMHREDIGVDDYEVKIIGFGETYLPGAREPFNSFKYQAPETLFDFEVDVRSDIWSLGCTVRCLVTA